MKFLAKKIKKSPEINLRLKINVNFGGGDVKGSGCGLVDRAVSSKTRGPQFESSYLQNLIMNMYIVSY